MKNRFNGLAMTIGQTTVAYGVYGICFGIGYAAILCVANVIGDAYGDDIGDWLDEHNPFKK